MGKRIGIYFIVLIILLLSFGCTNIGQVTFEDESNECIEIPSNEVVQTDSIMTNIEEKTQNSIIKEEHSSDYYIKWAVPEGLTGIDDERLERFNNKLEADGYEFGLQIVGIKEDFTKDCYQNTLDETEWDICFTGFEAENSNLAEKNMNSGKYADLTEYIEKSKLKELYPEIVFDRVRHCGKIYVLPSETSLDGYCCALLGNKNCLSSEAILSEVDSNIFNIPGYASQKDKLLYCLSGFEFALCLGYDYDAVRGVVMNSEGKIINPLENDNCMNFMRMIHECNEQGIVLDGNDDTSAAVIERLRKNSSFILKSSYYWGMNDEYIKILKWDIKARKSFKATTAINVNSMKKEQAFQLLELLRTDHEYGNLLIYGMGSKPGDKDIKSNPTACLIMGLADGIYGMDDEPGRFASAEERMAYYEKNVKASPLLYIDLPEDCSVLYGIVEKYLGMHTGQSILFHDNFEEELEQFRQEYTEAFDRIMKDFK